MVENKQELLRHKLVDAMNDVGHQLVEQREASPNIKTLRIRPGITWRPSDQFAMELMKTPTVAERFTVEDINEKLRKAFIFRG